MRELKHETIIVSKETYFFLRNHTRKIGGYSELSDESLERLWNRMESARNIGANSQTHPIDKNEVRIDRDSFGLPLNTMKTLINDNGFTYREDGYIVESIYI